MAGLLGLDFITKKVTSVLINAGRQMTYQDDINTHGGQAVTLVNAASTSATTFTSTVTTLPAPRRTGVLAQWVPDNPASVPANNVTIEIQWTPDGTNWYVAPTSTQGDNRTSTVTSSGADKSLISRGQVLTGSFRVQIQTTGTNFPAGKTYIFYADIT